jgi:RNA polymerase sigma-70 factor (ECF subfamily)
MASAVTRAGALDVTSDETRMPNVELGVRKVVAEQYDFVWRSLRRLGIPHEGPDDATQQVFCVFAKRVNDVRVDKEKLFGVVLRVAQSTRRSRARRREVSDEDAIASLPSERAGPQELLDERRACALLDAILAEMPMDLRAVFVLYEIEELKTLR